MNLFRYWNWFVLWKANNSQPFRFGLIQSHLSKCFMNKHFQQTFSPNEKKEEINSEFQYFIQSACVLFKWAFNFQFNLILIGSFVVVARCWRVLCWYSEQDSLKLFDLNSLYLHPRSVGSHKFVLLLKPFQVLSFAGTILTKGHKR